MVRVLGAGQGHVIPSNPEEEEGVLPGLRSPPAQALHSLLMMSKILHLAARAAVVESSREAASWNVLSGSLSQDPYLSLPGWGGRADMLRFMQITLSSAEFLFWCKRLWL